jgi:FAD:protein FMN transferase
VLTRRFRAMGSDIAVFLDGEDRQAALALEEAPLWFEAWEQVFSRFRPESELSRLNASEAQTNQISPLLWEVLDASLDAAAWTDGIVTPAMLAPLEMAGYDRSLELVQARTINSSWQVVSAEAPPMLLASWQDIILEAPDQITRPAGLRLDLGGIAKGWAAFACMRRLEAIGPVLVDAGGDLAVSGTRLDGQPWPVAVADPLQVHDQLALLALDRCGVATSGVHLRRWMKDGKWMHHLIDPRSGLPAQSDVVSATVIAETTVLAEAAAKMLLISGSQPGLSWLERQPDFSACLALSDGQVVFGGGFADFLWNEIEVR